MGNGKPAWSTKAFVRTVREIDHPHGVSCGMFSHNFSDKNPREWTKEALTTLDCAPAAYMVEVLAESDTEMQQLISCRVSTCLQLGQGKEVGYS